MRIVADSHSIVHACGCATRYLVLCPVYRRFPRMRGYGLAACKLCDWFYLHVSCTSESAFTRTRACARVCVARLCCAQACTSTLYAKYMIAYAATNQPTPFSFSRSRQLPSGVRRRQDPGPGHARQRQVRVLQDRRDQHNHAVPPLRHPYVGVLWTLSSSGKLHLPSSSAASPSLVLSITFHMPHPRMLVALLLFLPGRETRQRHVHPTRCADLTHAHSMHT